MRRSLPGQLDYIQNRLTEVGVLLIDATRTADSQAHSRFATEALVERSRDVAELAAKIRELRAEMIGNGLGPLAASLGAPIPLLLNRHADPSVRRLAASLEAEDR